MKTMTCKQFINDGQYPATCNEEISVIEAAEFNGRFDEDESAVVYDEYEKALGCEDVRISDPENVNVPYPCNRV